MQDSRSEDTSKGSFGGLPADLHHTHNCGFFDRGLRIVYKQPNSFDSRCSYPFQYINAVSSDVHPLRLLLDLGCTNLELWHFGNGVQRRYRKQINGLLVAKMIGYEYRILTNRLYDSDLIMGFPTACIQPYDFVMRDVILLRCFRMNFDLWLRAHVP